MLKFNKVSWFTCVSRSVQLKMCPLFIPCSFCHFVLCAHVCHATQFPVPQAGVAAGWCLVLTTVLPAIIRWDLWLNICSESWQCLPVFCRQKPLTGTFPFTLHPSQVPYFSFHWLVCLCALSPLWLDLFAQFLGQKACMGKSFETVTHDPPSKNNQLHCTNTSSEVDFVCSILRQ